MGERRNPSDRQLDREFEEDREMDREVARPAVPDLEAPQPLDAETFQLWNVLAETALNTPEWKREDVRRLCATIRDREARVKALQDALRQALAFYEDDQWFDWDAARSLLGAEEGEPGA